MDVLIFAKIRDQHFDLIQQVSSRLYHAGFRILKSTFLKSQIDYLGYIIVGKAIEMNCHHIQTFFDASAGTNRSEVRRFLGD